MIVFVKRVEMSVTFVGSPLPLLLLVTLSIPSLSSVLKRDCPSEPLEECPEDMYFDGGECRNCTKSCLPGFEKKENCGVVNCGFQFDIVCCRWYEYAAYGRCILDCSLCKGSGNCKENTLECDCPEGTEGVLCNPIVTITTEPPTTPEESSTDSSVPEGLRTWQIALIALGIVIGIVIFSTLFILASFCQYSRWSRSQAHDPLSSNDTVTTTVLDAQTNLPLPSLTCDTPQPPKYLLASYDRQPSDFNNVV